MRALNAATGTVNMFGFTLSRLPTSILDVTSAVASDPAMRKHALEFAYAAAKSFDLPERVRDAVVALFEQDNPPSRPPPIEPADHRTDRSNVALSSGTTTNSTPLSTSEVESDATTTPLRRPSGEPSPEITVPSLQTSKTLFDAVGARIINQRSTADTFVDRLRAYIPIEVLTFFIFVNSFTGSDLRSAKADSWLAIPTLHGWVAILLFLVSLLLIVIYTRRTGRQANTVWGLQAVISIIAFLIWTYNMNASVYCLFKIQPDTAVSAFCLGVFTLLTGFVVPIKKA